MNDTNYMDNNGNNGGNDVLVERKATVSDVSATDSLPVADTRSMSPVDIFILTLLGIAIVFVIMCNWNMLTNATENSVYVDEEYLATQFGSYEYYAIVTDGNGNYVTLFTNGKMIANGGTIYSLMSYDDFGFKTMKLEDDYLIVDEGGASYSGRSSVTVQLNSLSYGVPSGMNDFLYSNQDIYKVVFSNTGSPSASDEVFYSVANNIGAKPTEEPTTPNPSITVDCKFTDENIVEKLDTIDSSLKTLVEIFTEKIDLILTLLIVFMALKKFGPLANNHKRGLDRKEK